MSPDATVPISVLVAVQVHKVAVHVGDNVSTAQHPCALQHNATTGIIYIPSIVLAVLGGQLG